MPPLMRRSASWTIRPEGDIRGSLIVGRWTGSSKLSPEAIFFSTATQVCHIRNSTDADLQHSEKLKQAGNLAFRAKTMMEISRLETKMGCLETKMDTSTGLSGESRRTLKRVNYKVDRYVEREVVADATRTIVCRP